MCFLSAQTEDVLYASIDHTNINPERPTRDLEDTDCDYAVVMLPQKTTDVAKQKSSEDCSDDYVLMGWALKCLCGWNQHIQPEWTPEIHKHNFEHLLTLYRMIFRIFIIHFNNLWRFSFQIFFFFIPPLHIYNMKYNILKIFDILMHCK